MFIFGVSKKQIKEFVVNQKKPFSVKVIRSLQIQKYRESLLIRFGCIRSRIPYNSIKKVVPTRNPISSPALSLDRLRIDTGDTLGTNISPADKSSFLKYLAGQVNHLVLADGRLLSKEES